MITSLVIAGSYCGKKLSWQKASPRRARLFADDKEWPVTWRVTGHRGRVCELVYNLIKRTDSLSIKAIVERSVGGFARRHMAAPLQPPVRIQSVSGLFSHQRWISVRELSYWDDHLGGNQTVSHPPILTSGHVLHVWLCSQNDIGSILYPILLTFFTVLSLVTVNSDKKIQQYSEILVMIADVMFYRYYVFLKFKFCNT